jgi:hypothetical protein
MIEAQRQTYETMADSFIGFQKRNVEFFQSGQDLAELQEHNAEVARDLVGSMGSTNFMTNGTKVMELGQRNAQFFQSWITGGVDYLHNQAEHNQRSAEAFAESARAQQEGLRKLGEEWVSLYEDAASSSASYAEEGVQDAQEETQEGPQKKEWDELDHRRNSADGRFGPGEEWDESVHTRDTEGQFT